MLFQSPTNKQNLIEKCKKELSYLGFRSTPHCPRTLWCLTQFHFYLSIRFECLYQYKQKSPVSRLLNSHWIYTSACNKITKCFPSISFHLCSDEFTKAPSKPNQKQHANNTTLRTNSRMQTVSICRKCEYYLLWYLIFVVLLSHRICKHVLNGPGKMLELLEIKTRNANLYLKRIVVHCGRVDTSMCSVPSRVSLSVLRRLIKMCERERKVHSSTMEHETASRFVTCSSLACVWWCAGGDGAGAVLCACCDMVERLPFSHSIASILPTR